MRHRALLAWARADEPSARLWRAVLLFAVCDGFFSGLALAYAFKLFAVPGVLAFIAGQQILTTVGHGWAYRLMRTRSALGVLRAGVALFCLALAIGALLPRGAGSVAALCLLGGLARGLSYGARLWLEMHVPAGTERQRYLNAVEASKTLLGLGLPVLSAALLAAWHDEARVVFGLAAAVMLPVVAWQLRRPAPPGPSTGTLSVLALMRTPAYWRTASFYITDGASHAVRTALFVSGAMVVLGSVSRFSLMEACANALAAGMLAWQALHPDAGASLKKLALCLAVMALGWLCLLGALHWPGLLVGFVLANALALPLVTAQKASLTLQGMSAGVGNKESNSMARSVLLLAARLAALGLAALLAVVGGDALGTVQLMAALALVLLPLEYLFARRLARACADR